MEVVTQLEFVWECFYFKRRNCVRRSICFERTRQMYAYPSIKPLVQWMAKMNERERENEWTIEKKKTYLVKDSLNCMIYENGVHFTVAMWCIHLNLGAKCVCMQFVPGHLWVERNERKRKELNSQWMIVKSHAAVCSTSEWVFRFNSFEMYACISLYSFAMYFSCVN